MRLQTELDLFAPAFKADPYPTYARLRERAPVVYVRRGFRNRPTWLLTRYDDVAALLRDDKRFAKHAANALTAEQLRKAPGLPGPLAALANNLLSVDPPRHTRLRAVVQRAFTPRIIEGVREAAEDTARSLVDRMIEKRGARDLLADFASPLPLEIIARILGVAGRDTSKFQKWTRAFAAVRGSPTDVFKLFSIFRLMRYLRRTIKARAAEPRDDLISLLVQAREQDDQLTEDEVLAMVFLLLSAGHETTVNLIASGTLALLRHRDQWRRLRKDPSLIPSAIEELLRFVTPAEMTTERFTRQDVEIAGVTIPRGEIVLGVIASANRDERVFERAEILDIERRENKHLSFGLGTHYCLGAALARLEASIAIRFLVERAPELRLAVPVDRLRWRSNLILRGLKKLPVVFT